MKKIGIICIVLLYLMCLCSASATEAAEDISVISGGNTLDGRVPFLGTQQIDSNMQSAVMYELNSDTLMYAYNADEKLPPSSLLKILTALIAIENGTLTDVVTVQERVLNTLDKDAVSVDLLVDEVVTVQDLLYCMMVASGNDAAVILADYIMGSQETFVAEMNRYAAELGCTDTNFTNVHGLHDENQYTTARDVARILAKALGNEKFCEIFGAKYYTMPETNKSEERYLSSQNYLINNDADINYFDERVKGSRTAIANDRSRSIASVAQVNDMKLICVVMGAGSQYEKDGYTVKVYGGYNETKKLLDLGFNGYKTAQLLYPNQVVIQKSVINGSSDLSIGTKTSAFSVIPDDITEATLTYRYVNEIPLTAPIKKGQLVSTLQIWCGNVCISQTDLYAMNSVTAIGTNNGNNAPAKELPKAVKVAFGIVGVVVAVILLGLAVLFVLRMRYLAKIKHRRHYRRSR